ncbi:hypothetical protein ACFQMM_10945 [Saliphagus sp. GCM10025308]
MDRTEMFLVVIAWELAAIVLTTAGGTEWFIILPSLLLLIVLPIYLLAMLVVDSVSQQTLTRLVRLR